jgi:chromosome transmission fidelity protein 8
MFGKVANLDKPLILLKKVHKVIERTRCEEDMDEGEEEPSETKPKTEYVIEAIIRKKILFNKRPRPIVSLETKIKF